MTQIICKNDAAHFILLFFAASLYHILRKWSFSKKAIFIKIYIGVWFWFLSSQLRKRGDIFI
jgi:hypothetical protein